MTAAQVAAQLAVDAANNQKSRCELLLDSVTPLPKRFMSPENAFRKMISSDLFSVRCVTFKD